MASHANAQYFAEKLREMDLFKIIHHGAPDQGIPTVVWTLDENPDHGFNLYDFADRLRMRGWQVPAYPFTGELESTAFQRILVKRDFTRDMADLLLQDIRQAIEHFQKHPITNNLLAAEAASYNHL
jgi:glutamate decarboxylase